MTTTVTSLVDRVRDVCDDYGDVSTTLGAAVADTTTTSVTVSATVGIDEADWLNVDYETMYVSKVPTGPPYTLTVRRAQRGTTAATHLNGATVLVSPLYPNNRILNALNSALGKMSKIVKDVATLAVVEDQFAYAVPSTIDVVKRVEIENSDEDSEFYVIRTWEMLDSGYFRIMGNYDEARNIAVIGTSKFTALATTGNLDTTFPDSNVSAINYLIYEAAGQLLLQRQAKIAGRDSFEGMTDAFAQSQPDHSVRVARQFLAEAERYRQIAMRQCAILQPPVAPTQDPGRVYLARI